MGGTESPSKRTKPSYASSCMDWAPPPCSPLASSNAASIRDYVENHDGGSSSGSSGFVATTPSSTTQPMASSSNSSSVLGRISAKESQNKMESDVAREEYSGGKVMDASNDDIECVYISPVLASAVASQATEELTNKVVNGGEGDANVSGRPIPITLAPDDFHLDATVGQGGFGQVFLVRPRDSALQKVNLEPDGLYALKCIKKAKLAKSETEKKHVRAELRVLNRLTGRHPFILDLKASFQNSTHIFILTEFLHGGELFNLVSYMGINNRGIPESMARVYMAEIAVAVGFLHSKDILYRDLKPENVMIATDGHIKLIDFGLCKDKIKDLNYATYCGTKEYMAPEVAKRERYGRPADWWSFGALSYDLICNQYPLAEALAYDKPIDYPRYMSKRLVNLLQHLLCVDVDNRWSTLEEIQRDPFFFEITNWTWVKNKQLKPPFLPEVPTGMRFNPDYIEPDFYKLRAKLPSERSEQDFGFFKNFDYVHKSVALKK